MIPLRLLGLGAAAFLVGGCTQPAPVVHVTVIMQQPPAQPPQAKVEELTAEEPIEWTSSVPDPVTTRIFKGRHPWPKGGWRVNVCPQVDYVSNAYEQCLPYGPPLEFVEQCHILAKTAQQDYPARKIECEWMWTEGSADKPNARVMRNAVPD